MNKYYEYSVIVYTILLLHVCVMFTNIYTYSGRRWRTADEAPLNAYNAIIRIYDVIY